jgi:hypothetical protein
MLTLVTGLLNTFLIPFGFYRCWKLGGEFSFKKYPLSYVTKTKYKNIFIFYVSAISVTQIFFLFGLLSSFKSLPDYLVALPFTSMVALLISGLVHSSINKPIHRTAIVYMVISLIAWSGLWHLFLYDFNLLVGILGLGITLTVLIGCPALHLYYKNFGMSELLFAGATVCWNILMIVFIINN